MNWRMHDFKIEVMVHGEIKKINQGQQKLKPTKTKILNGIKESQHRADLGV